MNNSLKSIQSVLEQFFDAAINVLPEFVIAMLVLTAFVFASRGARWGTRKITAKRDMEPSLRKLFESVVGATLIAVGIFIAAAILFPGLSAGDLVGVLGLSSVAIGFAFKDIFQNFLAGVLMLSRRPFRIDDYIETNDLEGFVQDISFRNTTLRTRQGEELIIPNSVIFTNPVRVRTSGQKIRSTFSTGIGYDEDVEEARRVLLDVAADCEGVLDDPEPMCIVTEHDASSVNFELKFWTDSEPGYALRAKDEIATKSKLALDEAGIEIPFPQRVIHLVSDQENAQNLA